MKVLWTDKKRLWGLKKILWIFPTSFTKYTVNEKAIIVKTGMFSIKEEQVILFRVTDISLRKTFFNRLFRVGSIIVQSDDRTIPNLKITNIKKPEALRNLLNDAIEAARRKNMVISREFLNKPDDDCTDCGEDHEDQFEDYPDSADE